MFRVSCYRVADTQNQQNNSTNHNISDLDALLKAGSKSIEAVLCKRWILFAEFDETVEVRDVWKTDGGRELRVGAEKRVDGMSHG